MLAKECERHFLFHIAETMPRRKDKSAVIHLLDTDIQISYYHVLRQNSEFILSLQRQTDIVLHSR